MTELPIDKHIDAARREARRHAWGPHRVEGALGELFARRQREDAFRRRATVMGGGALALAAAVSLVIVGWQTLRPTAAPQASSTEIQSLQHLTIGAGMEARYTPAARVEVRERNDARVVVSVEGGRAEFQVRHDPRRVFRVQAGDVQVEDLGTVFAVDNSAGQVRVAVTEGSVAVSYPRPGAERGSAVLGAGQSGVYPASVPGPSAEVTGAPTLAPSAASPVASREEPRASSQPSSGWRELARGGKHGRAYELLAPGGFRDVRDEPGDLLLAADAARLSQHPAEAANLLRKLLAGHQRDPRAPSAAFTLGWLLMKDLGRPREAAQAFSRAEALAPRGNLAEDAMARAVEAWHRAGDVTRAKAEVERYRKKYPSGRHLPMLERLVK